jgi:plasmid maintenance system antidote protein VapI
MAILNYQGRPEHESSPGKSLVNTTPQFWLNLQSHYELDQARLSSAREIEKTIHPLPKAA